VAAIFDKFDRIAGLWFVEARPTTVGIKLRVALEQFGTATLARKGANATLFEQLAGIGAFGSGFAKNVILELAQFFTPLVFTFNNRIVHRIAFRLPNINRTHFAVLEG
jgi:hypothetical protein